MVKKTKKIGSKAKEQRILLWWERMNVLNEYLPDVFPHFKEAKEPSAVMMGVNQEWIISVDGSARIDPIEFQRSLGVAASAFQHLFKFSKISGDGKKAYLKHSGIPTKFEGLKFARTYAHEVYPEQMRDMLRALKIPPGTIQKCCKIVESDFLESDLEAFIKRIKLFSKSHPDVGVLSYEEIEKDFHILPEQLDDWSNDPSLTKIKISILPRQKLVSFPYFHK